MIVTGTRHVILKKNVGRAMNFKKKKIKFEWPIYHLCNVYLMIEYFVKNIYKRSRYVPKK